jgi:hypothetical protein
MHSTLRVVRLVPVNDRCPDLFRRFAKNEKAHIVGRDHALGDHEIEVDRAPPVRLSDKDDG